MAFMLAPYQQWMTAARRKMRRGVRGTTIFCTSKV
jgi:hypothetical protein